MFFVWWGGRVGLVWRTLLVGLRDVLYFLNFFL